MDQVTKDFTKKAKSMVRANISGAIKATTKETGLTIK
jgi:hypothetical protein